MRTIKNILNSTWTIHLFVILGLFALWGYLARHSDVLLFLSVLSFAGAICGAFGRVIDTINNHNSRK